MTPWITAAELAPQLSALKWLWPGWIPLGQVTVLGAQAGRGKSALALRLALSVTSGESWPDGQAAGAKPAPIVWVETERRERMNEKRRAAFGVPADLMVVHQLRHQFRIDVPADLLSLRDAIAEWKPRLVVIDSFRAAHRLGENSPKVGDLIQDLDTIASDLGPAILLVHHFRKLGAGRNPERLTADEFRGSSTIMDRPQSMIALDEPDPEGSRGHIRISHVKCSDGEARPSLGMRWADGHLAFDTEPPAPHLTPTIRDLVAAQLQLLLADGERTTIDVMAALAARGLNYETAKKIKGAYGIEQFKRGRNGFWRLRP